MRVTKILPAILAIVPATVFLTAQASLSEPAKECKSKPDSASPPGSHWYYRINRADKRHCWYLSAVELHVRRADHVPTPVPAEDVTAVAADPPLMSAPPAQTTNMSAPPAQTTDEIDFSARWPEHLPQIEDASSVEPPSVSSSYADPPPATDTTAPISLRWPVVETTDVQTTSIADTVLNYIFVVGLMTTASLLLVGWAAKFARRPVQPRRSDWRPYGRTLAER